MNTSSENLIAYLNNIQTTLNLYVPMSCLILGTVGHLLNILIFTRPRIRTNACSIYFVSGSVVNFVSLYVGLITPFLGIYNLDPTQKINILCKIRYYLRYSTITLSTWSILLACFNRLCSTSNAVSIRLWSSALIAKRIIILASIICFIGPYTQVFYCYETNSRQKCLSTNITCKLLNTIILLLCNSGLPPVLMILLSILTIRNVKYLNHIMVCRRRDVQLIRLLLIQVLCLFIFSIPTVAEKIYTCSTIFMNRDSLSAAIDNFVIQVSTEISYVSNSMIFYIYSLTSKTYRDEAFRILSSLWKVCQRVKIHPLQVIDSPTLNNKNQVVAIPNESHELTIQTKK